MLILHRSQRFVSTALFLAVIGTFLQPAYSADKRPNILFIMSDDHAYQAISAYGSNRNETPNIDRIAREGMRFDRCLVTNSICSPVRAVILTGKYSHLNGVPDNYTEFDGSQPTVPKMMQAAGYQTAMIGKWHLKSLPTGFDYFDVLRGQGKYYSPDFISEQGQRVVPGYTSDVVTELTLEWLRNQRSTDKPFMLMMQHKAPHRPWDPGPNYVTKYLDTTFPEPETLHDDYANRSSAAETAEMRINQMRPDGDLKIWEEANRHRKWLYKHMSDEERALYEAHFDPRKTKFDAASPQGKDLTRWFYQLYMNDYLGCIDSVDESVGRVLDYLDESGLAENTIVVYTSDQGFYLGEHGWFDKRFMYEESLRTPFLVRWPGKIQPGSTNDQIVSNVDFPETFLDIAGAEIPGDMQGRSLAPLLKGETPDDWRESFYYHYYEGPERDHAVQRHYGVATDRYKLIHYYEIDEWELFDLESDPLEMKSVYGAADYTEVQKDLESELARLRTELKVEKEG